MGKLETLMMYKIAAFFFLVLFSSEVAGQQKKHIEGAFGESVLADDITLTEARSKAIQEARIAALRQAGVSEYVSEINVFQKSEIGATNFTELFNSLTSLEVNGEISSYKIIKEEKATTPSGSFVVRVWINADVVIQERRSDPTFYANVSGMRENYLNGDKLSFEVKPSSAGYLNVFIIDEKECSVLYPNKLERTQKLEPTTAYKFPLSRALDYEVTTANNVEINYVIFLYTKNQVNYMSGTAIPDILNFISHIPPNEKFSKMYPIVIKKPQP